MRWYRYGDPTILFEVQEQHGHTVGGRFSPTYQSWRAMKERVLNPNHKNYLLYGGRGVTIHQPWIDSFERFLADMGERPEGKSLDRVNPEGNYEPSNCRWATQAEQVNNRRVAA